MYMHGKGDIYFIFEIFFLYNSDASKMELESIPNVNSHISISFKLILLQLSDFC